MTTVGRQPEVLRWIHDLCLSIYCGLLFGWLEELRPYAWSGQGRFLYFWHPHAVRLTESDFVLFYMELFLIPAAATFVVLLLIRRIPYADALLGTVGFVVALAGIPFACLYRHEFGQATRLFVQLALVIAVAVCLLLWAYRKLRISGRLALVLLSMYYVLVGFFGGGADLIFAPPRWGWGIWDYARIVYPALGFCYTLIWAAYFRPGRQAAPIAPN